MGGGIAYALTRASTVAGSARLASPSPLPAASLASTDGSQSVDATDLASASATSSVEIEVPDVTGKSLAAAEAVLQVAGLRTETRVADPPMQGVMPETVISQWPNAGARARSGDRVVLTYQPSAGVSSSGKQFVVVIDPGHQAKANLTLEPIGPGSATKKEKVRGGATGVATRIPEYKEALTISLLLRDRLQGAGVKVVMVRTTNDVDIANSQRAIVGNKANADLVVRVHLDSVSDGTVHGISVQYPSGNKWCQPIETPSKRAAALVEDAVTAATGGGKRGLFPRSDMTGFNWSTRPTIIVECGFMSNADEDRRCATAAYQGLLATGISKGVLAYLGL